MAKIITEHHCKEVLLRKNPAFIFESYQIGPFKEESRGGLIGLHYTLRIYYTYRNEKQTIQYFVKTLNDHSRTMFEISKNLLFFEKEKLFFTNLLPKYELIGINVSFAPKGYLCEDNAVILEDLTLSGFKLFSKKRSLDIEHCHACLTLLAQFHASSLLYDIWKSKTSGIRYNLLNEHPYILEDLIYSGGDTDGTRYMEKSVEGLIALTELEFGDGTTLENMKNMFDLSDSSDDGDLCCVLLHGDLWTNNFLHKYDGDRIIESKLIDFQTIRYGPPCLDVLQFIYSNTRKSLRDRHSNDLLNFYYQKLNEIFEERSLCIGDYLPKKQFFDTCEIFKLRVKLQAVIDRCLTGVPDQTHNNIPSDENEFNDFLFVDRAKYYIENYTTNPMYKELISEDLRELKDMLPSLKCN